MAKKHKLNKKTESSSSYVKSALILGLTIAYAAIVIRLILIHGMQLIDQLDIGLASIYPFIGLVALGFILMLLAYGAVFMMAKALKLHKPLRVVVFAMAIFIAGDLLIGVLLKVPTYFMTDLILSFIAAFVSIKAVNYISHKKFEPKTVKKTNKKSKK